MSNSRTSLENNNEISLGTINHSTNSTTDTSLPTSQRHTRFENRRRVRTNVAQALFSTTPDSNNYKITRIFLIIQLLFTLSQLIATATVLGISWNKPCDSPLFLFLCVYFIQLLLHSVILQVELYNLYRQSSQRQPVESSAPIALLPPSLIVLANLLEVGSLLWYFFGNIWLFNANMCYKPLFVLSAVWVAWGYLVIGFPLLLCFLLIFCLPCMLWLSNFIGARSWLLSHLNPTLLGNPTGRNVNGNGSSASGLKKQEIDSLPCFVYGDVKNEASNDTGHNHSFEPEDANCCICLNDYVAGQTVVKILPVCSHHFDSECLDRWLALHGTCPLCVQRVFPSESTDDDASSASSVEYYLQNTL